jgi:cyanophycinase
MPSPLRTPVTRRRRALRLAALPLALPCALACALLASLPIRPAHAQPAATALFPDTARGPARGTLVIAGGGNLDGSGIPEAFIAAAGGPTAKIVIVPTAGGNRGRDGAPIVYGDSAVLAPWRARGLDNVHLLHTHDPKVADTEAFAAVLADATGVWFNGGRQWNLVDSYGGTRTERAFHAVLARGGVIGGSSAGASIQGDLLVRGAVAGAQLMIAPEPEHFRGFNFLRGTAIDQHINARNRWDDLQEVLARHPALLGIGISEATAIVVRGDAFEVIGKAQVAVHDARAPQQANGKAYRVLEAGTRYDLAGRRLLP